MWWIDRYEVVGSSLRSGGFIATKWWVHRYEVVGSSLRSGGFTATKFLCRRFDRGYDDWMPQRISPAAAAPFIDSARLDALIAPIVSDEHDRAFVVRCILDEGPRHHRGANFVLLTLLGTLIEKLQPVDVEALRAAGTLPVPMRVPPHLARPGSMMAYPLPLPTSPLDRLAPSGSTEQAAMVDCLTDGPPQHALANAVMVWLIGAALAKLDPPQQK
jgi:hypothetical protein